MKGATGDGGLKGPGGVNGATGDGGLKGSHGDLIEMRNFKRWGTDKSSAAVLAEPSWLQMNK